MSIALHLHEPPLIHIPTNSTTWEGFCAWAISGNFPVYGRVPYLNEEVIFDMSPEELETLNKVKTAVSRRIFFLSQELELGPFYDDRTLLLN